MSAHTQRVAVDLASDPGDASLCDPSLFLVTDAFGKVPVFLSVLAPGRRRRVIVCELLFELVSMFAGRFRLNASGLTETSLTVAGGLVLDLAYDGVPAAR